MRFVALRSHGLMLKMPCVSSGSAALMELIRSEIAREGSISFARFMAHALYHEEHGYYSSGRALLGRGGDYLTNVSVGPAFGQLIALQLVEIWQTMERPAPFVVVEQGAHGGELAADILEFTQQFTREFFAALQYEIIEPFAALRHRQHAGLTQFGDKIRWHDSIAAMEPFTGIHLSNELFDALPFHLIRSDGSGKWSERCVTLDEESFALTSKPIADDDLAARVARLPVRPAGFESEVTLAARPLLQQLAQKMTHGLVLAIDYGFPAEEFYAEERASGTMQCRAAHRILASPFDRPGESDITAHVEWSSLIEDAKACGFSVVGFTDQHHFLTGVLAAAPEWMAAASSKLRRELQTLLHPEMFGRSFQVLGLSKGLNRAARLSGFKFASG